jgi:multidrug resistance efflux pump
VDLPLVVEVGGQQYAVFDWSLGGVGVRGFSMDSIEDREKIAAHIILPMPDSVLSLTVTLGFISQHGEKTGFKFVDLSVKHRRVLRHYIELSIEGKLENLEDLVAIVSSPQIASPIQEALNLSDLEEESLVRKFRQRSYLSITMAVLFISAALGVIFYNTMYRISTTGLISGTIRPISVGCAGTLKDVFVASGDWVIEGQELFTVKDNQRALLARKIEEQIAEIQEKLDYLRATTLSLESPLVHELLEDYQENHRIYEEAQLLFKEGGITRKDLHLAKSYSLRSKVAYERFLSSYQERYQREQAEIQRVTRQQQRLQDELRAQAPDATVCMGLSPVAGEVFKIEKRSGDYVSANDIMGLVNMDTTPEIIIKLRSADALKIEIGMAASIYAPSLKTKYEARVAAIGYSAISGTSSLTLEASLNETLVKLKFVDPTVRFPVGNRVGVWIKTF